MKITLCGSTRYRNEYEEANKILSANGHLVYSVSCFDRQGVTLSNEEKELLDLVHLRKIQESDCIVVVGTQDGAQYIGTSTKREMLWARLLGKPIYCTDHVKLESI